MSKVVSRFLTPQFQYTRIFLQEKFFVYYRLGNGNTKGNSVQIDWTIAQANLTSVAVLVFIFGFFAARMATDMKIPNAIYQFISIYLLFGIGLKGGHSLHGVAIADFALPAVTTIALGFLVPLFAFTFLRFIRQLTIADRGAIAAHYGSTSLITFSAAMLFLENSGIEVNGYATALLTLMEIPGIVLGIYLGSRGTAKHVRWSETIKEVLAGKTVLLLVAGLLIGVITSDASYQTVVPFFIDLQNGLLTLFLMHLGYLAGSQWSDIRKLGMPIIIFGIAFPPFAGALGVLAGTAIGLTIGGAAILGVLCASASYIAAPAAVGIGLPTANGSLALTSSIGITFPFNLVLGIPLYTELAKILGS